MSTIQRECPVCGKSYLADEYRLSTGRNTTCSRECSYVFRGQRQRRRVSVTCERCGNIFETIESKSQRARYCSKACQHPPLIKVCANCGKEFRTPPSSNAVFCSRDCHNASEQKSIQASIATKRAWKNPEVRKRLMEGIKRRSKSEQWRSAPHFQSGDKHPRYKGHRRQRQQNYEYKKWRSDVLKKDNYTCQQCGKRGVRLQAHHIKPWATHPEMRYEVSNGMAVCRECHDRIHGRKSKPPTKICQNCGKRYEPRRSTSKYCSRKCYIESRRKG